MVGEDGTSGEQNAWLFIGEHSQRSNMYPYSLNTQLLGPLWGEGCWELRAELKGLGLVSPVPGACSTGPRRALQTG